MFTSDCGVQLQYTSTLNLHKDIISVLSLVACTDVGRFYHIIATFNIATTNHRPADYRFIYCVALLQMKCLMTLTLVVSVLCVPMSMG